MSNIARLPGANLSTHDAKALALIKRTVAADTNDDEFSLFIHMARALGLDPLRRQIYAFVFGKNARDQSKRKMSIITGIDGFRSIADRTGNYRPDEDEPTIDADPALVSPHNPAGIIKATVRVYKFSHGGWHKVTSSAHWEEFAPLKEGWSETRQIADGQWPDGNTKYKTVAAEGATKTVVLDTSGQWGKMPRLMLAKVAEALALRKAWPDNFANVYAAEEIDRAKLLDITPAEAAAEGAAQERMEKIGARDAILIDWLDSRPMEPVPAGKLADRIFAFIDANAEEASQVGIFADRNRHSLRMFWAVAPGDAIEVKKRIEAACPMIARAP